MVKYYIKHGQVFRDNHPNCKTTKKYNNVYEWFVRDLFYQSLSDFDKTKERGLFDEKIDYKAFLEDYFKVKL